MQTIELRSNMGGRLRKIREGVVYQNITSVIGELGQNAQRAQATKLTVELHGDSLVFTDDGKGCSDPQTVFELDYSGFGVGFGEGFSSVFTIADDLTVLSTTWRVHFDVNEIMKSGDFILNVEQVSPLIGFTVSLRGEKIRENERELAEFIREMGALLPMKVIFNGEEIKKRDLMKMRKEDFSMEFDNDFFTAVIAPQSEWADMEIYFENRYVMDFWKPGIKGNIILKPNAVTLKAPDRREIIYDEKRTAFDNALEDCARELYRNFIQVAEDSELNAHDEYITKYLSVEDYLEFLPMDEKILSAKRLEQTDKMLSDAEILKRAGLDMPHTYHSGGSHTEGGENLTLDYMDDADINMLDDSRYEGSQTIRSKLVRLNPRKRGENAEFIDKLKGMQALHKVLWIRASEAKLFEEAVNEMEYYGFTIVLAVNRLYERAFDHLGIANMLDADKVAEKKFTINSIGAADNKERRVLWMLERIEKHYKLPSTFRIADIDEVVEHFRNGIKVDTEQRVCSGLFREDRDGRKRIYLDRKSLQLPTYRISNWESGRLTLNDLRMMLKNFEVIAHELAHLLNGTSDNTKEHTDAQSNIMKEIAALF